MKSKYFYLICFIILIKPVFSQLPFKFITGDNLDNYPSSIIELSNGNYLCSYITFKPYVNSKLIYTTETTILELSTTGKVVSSKTLQNYSIKGIKQQGDNFFCYGYFRTETTYKIVAIILDKNYNLVKENKYILPYYDPNNGIAGSGFLHESFLEYNNNYYCTFTIRNVNPTTIKTTCFVLSNNADSLNSVFINGCIIDICKQPLNKGILMSGIFYDYNCTFGGNLHVAYVDTAINLKKVDCIYSGDTRFVINCNINNYKNNFIISGLTYNIEFDQLVGAGIYDTTSTIKHFKTIGNKLETQISAEKKGLSIDINENVFLASTYGYNGLDPYPVKDNYIVLAKMDSLLNKKWERFIGGDAYYVVNEIIACSDGGVLMSATIYDENINNNEYDVCIIKIDSNGNCSNIIKQPNLSKTITLYPNPCNTILTIKLPDSYSSGQLLVYNIFGKQVLMETINTNKQTLNVENLAKGIYVYKYIVDNKEIEKGKFVKE